MDCGYNVVAARGGVEALTLARDLDVHVLLTDVLMPQLSGQQLVVRYIAKYPRPTIMYMTGVVDDATMRLEMDGDVILLRKPFTPYELARAVRTALDARNAAFPTVNAS